MRTQRTFGAAVLMLAGAWSLAGGQEAQAPKSAGQTQIVFAFERQGLPVPKFKLTIHDDGSAVYEGEEVLSVAGAAPATADPPRPFRSQVQISLATAGRIFELSNKLDRFNTTCGSKVKNIADTGTKTLSYAAPDGAGTCTYNYSENKDVQALTEIFEGIAETMDQGRRLDYLRRFDRLGLDDAIAFLAQEVSSGRALEVGTIAASLRSIAEDADVMQRVRARARALLAQVVPGDGAR